MEEARGERVVEGSEGGGSDASVPVRSSVYNRGKWTRRNDSPEFFDFLVSKDEFEEGERIGQGAFANCYLGVQKKTNLKVAMTFYRENKGVHYQKMMLRMVTYLGRFAHPLIVPLIGFGIAPSQFLVTKFMPNGDLRSMLKREQAGDPPEGWDATAKSKCVFGIAAGMAFLHSKNIIHRDLKPSNVLLDDDFEPVIGGLGLATEYLAGAEMDISVSPLFMAPEVIMGESYDHKVDVYSFAVVLYQLFTDSIVVDDGSNIMASCSAFRLLSAVAKGRRLKRVDNIPDFYWDLICKCWSQDPKDRPSFVEIVKYLRAHASEYAFEGSDLLLVREYEMHALESISDVLSVDLLSQSGETSGDLSSDQVVPISGVDLSKYYVCRHDYNRESVIGGGTYGTVFKGICKRDGSFVAIKQLNVNLGSESERLQYEREVGILAGVKHPALLSLCGCTPFIDNYEPPLIITPYMARGSVQCLLEDELRKHHHGEWDITRKHIVLYGIACGMEYLHSCRIIHRDLKPGNILLDDSLEPHICDFGLSKYVEPGQTVQQSMYLGTPIYMAPEIHQGGSFEFKVDVYAYGMLMYFVLTGLQPFGDCADGLKVINKVIEGERPPIPCDLSSGYGSLIESCWSQFASQRPSFSSIVSALESESLLKDIDRSSFVEYQRKVCEFRPVCTSTGFDFIQSRYERGKWLDISCFYVDKYEYDVVGTLGRGTYGCVYQCRRKGSDLFVARKDLFGYGFGEEGRLRYEREVCIMGNIRHHCLLELHGCSPFNIDSCPSIFTQYMIHGSVDDMIDKEMRGLGESVWDCTRKHIVLYGVASGMHVLHSHRVIHRDLKPGNILLDSSFEPKISDFGLSKYVAVGETLEQSMLECGTPLYMAPEILDRSSHFGFKVDVYAFGIVMWSILTGSVPFKGISRRDLRSKVLSGERPPIGGEIPSAYVPLMKRCWNSSPSSRPNFHEIVSELESEELLKSLDLDLETFRSYQAKVKTE